MKREIMIALIGNPNIGKTTIFNLLTGSRQHVGNWPGVTVEKKTGRLSRNGYDIEVVDLPGTYSLTAYSADEIIARDFILEGNPDVVVQVVDATNMERTLYLTLQVAELGVPTVIALNMVDLARAQGDGIDHERLSASQGIPIFYDPGTGKPAVLWESWTQPRPNRYDGPVAILVSPYTISSGEGLPKVFAESGTGAIVSWYGTNGAFGIESIGPTLPLGIVTAFPMGASLDESGRIQVDSNASLIGGVAPTVRVPLDRDTLARAMAGEDVHLAYAVDWLKAEAMAGSAEHSPLPTQKAAAARVVPLAALAFIVVWHGRR